MLRPLVRCAIQMKLLCASTLAFDPTSVYCGSSILGARVMTVRSCASFGRQPGGTPQLATAPAITSTNMASLVTAQVFEAATRVPLRGMAADIPVPPVSDGGTAMYSRPDDDGARG